MPDIAVVEQVIKDFLRRAKKPCDTLDREQSLYAEGLGLDSLSIAELSAVLEDEFGTDPFSEGKMPIDVGALLDFYAARPAASGG